MRHIFTPLNSFSFGKFTFRHTPLGRPSASTFCTIWRTYGRSGSKSASDAKSQSEKPIDGMYFIQPSMVTPIVPL